MKVLYIGYYKENSEWGKMATNFILSMHAAGIDVVPRAINLGVSRKVGGLIAELEKGSVEDCDVCIQHVFPDHFVGSERFKKNIAIFTNDFVEIKHSTAVEKLNQATEVWVTNDDSLNILQPELSVPVKKVYPAFRAEAYQQKYQEVSLGEGVDGTFSFYSVVNSISDRDNILSTFHSTFGSAEQVSLILFSTNPDPSFANQLNKYSADIKTRLRLKQNAAMFKPDAILHMPEASETDIYALHQYADCYVSSSQGDAWPVTAFDAAAFGNTPIMANFGGASEFCDPEYLVPSVFSVSLGSGPVREERNGYDYIITPCQKAIKEKMRLVYDKYQQNPIKASNEKRVAGMAIAKKFSLEESGNRIKELINA
jgi:hypothetical protein